MGLRPWVAAPLAVAAVVLVSPTASATAQASTRHTSGSLRVYDGGDDAGGPRNPWRNCHSPRGVVLIDKNLRMVLINAQRGPEAILLHGPADVSSPEAPWSSFTVAGYLSVMYPTKTSDRYQFEIRDFFRVHPLLVVKAFAHHKRVFPFPATHCIDEDDRGGGNDGARPHGGASADGGDSSGSPAGSASPSDPRDARAAGWSARLLSGKQIIFAAGGLLLILGTLALAWLRRRRSAE